MKRWSLLLCIMLCTSQQSLTIVKRHDVQGEAYEVAKEPGYLIDMPYEGHGVLISPQWVVTVGHVIFSEYKGKTLEIGGERYTIDKVIVHPGYKKPGPALFKGDMQPLMDFLKSSDDIALVKLTAPVTGVVPIKLYEGEEEQGKEITIFGRGATGTGLVGERAETKPLRVLNFCRNIIEEVDRRWLLYRFDSPPAGLPLEGMHGSGDSGGPSVIGVDNVPYLVGLSSWQYLEGDIAEIRTGLYGTMAYQVRLSHYREWIRGVMDRG